MHLPGSIRLANAPSCSRRLQNAITSRRFSSLHRKRAIALPNSKYPTQRCPYPNARERIQQRNSSAVGRGANTFLSHSIWLEDVPLVRNRKLQTLTQSPARSFSYLRRKDTIALPTNSQRSVALVRKQERESNRGRAECVVAEVCRSPACYCGTNSQRISSTSSLRVLLKYLPAGATGSHQHICRE